MIDKSLWGVTRHIPETEEEGWDADVTGLLSSLTDGLDGLSLLSGGVVFLRQATVSATYGAAGTVSPTSPAMRIAGAAAPVTLSAVTAIADGAAEGQLLTLIGNHATRVVTILDGANVNLAAGDITLKQGDSITFRWDATAGEWLEVSRSGLNGFVLPAAVGLGYLYSDVNGNIAVTPGSASLQTAYLAGGGVQLDAVVGPFDFHALAGFAQNMVTLHHEGNGAIFSATQDGNNPILIGTKGGAGAGNVLDLTNAGTGYCVLLTQNGNNVALRIAQAANQPCIQLHQVGTGPALDSDSDLQLANAKGLTIKTAAAASKDALRRNASNVLILGDSSLDAELDLVGGGATTDIVLKLGATEYARLYHGGLFGLGTATPGGVLDAAKSSDPIIVFRNTNHALNDQVNVHLACAAAATAAGNTASMVVLRAIAKQVAGSLKGVLAILTNQGDSLVEMGRFTEGGGLSIGYVGDGHRVHIENAIAGKACLYAKQSGNVDALSVEQTVDHYTCFLQKNTGAGNSVAVLGISNSTTADSIKDAGSAAKLTAAGVWTDASRAILKENFERLCPAEMLEKVSRLKITQWNYRSEGTMPRVPRHIGPTAEDFYAAFEIGDEEGVSGRDLAAVALVSIQGLLLRVEALEKLRSS